MTDHHPLDIKPLPQDQTPLFINEPWLIDDSIYFDTQEQKQKLKNPEEAEDNRRVYIPLDLNKAAFLRRLDHVLSKYKDITWKNESNVGTEVDHIISQLEIYDRIWFVREGEYPTDEHGMISGHSHHATEVVKEIIARLEQIETCVDFPYFLIDVLKKEYDV